MGNDIVQAASRELKTANADQISGMTENVVELDRDLRESNNELCLLTSAIDSLGKTLEKNNQLKNIVRISMQKVITKL